MGGPTATAATGSNVARHLPHVARQYPYRRAVVSPHGRDRMGRTAYTHLTFDQLDRLSSAYAHGLTELGIGRGTRVLLMVRPGLDFIALTFALLKTGSIPVLIDPGMGWTAFLRCVARVEPEAFIGVPAAHLLRRLRPRPFRSVRTAVTLGPHRIGRTPRRRDLLRTGRDHFPVADTGGDDTAAILFTSGSTGPAKGVIYTHAIFDAQIRVIRDLYGITPEDVDLPCFPLFALFSTAMGIFLTVRFGN